MLIPKTTATGERYFLNSAYMGLVRRSHLHEDTILFVTEKLTGYDEAKCIPYTIKAGSYVIVTLSVKLRKSGYIHITRIDTGNTILEHSSNSVIASCRQKSLILEEIIYGHGKKTT